MADGISFDGLFNNLAPSLVRRKDARNPALYVGNRLPVDVIQFVEDPFYLGGQVELATRVKEVLWHISDGEIREADVEVGKGGGKSEIGQIVTSYEAYVDTCFKNPHQFYGLAPSTIIASINVSISEKQAKEVIFTGLSHKLRTSPYFSQLNWSDTDGKTRNGPVILTDEIELPNRIKVYCGHSSAVSKLGFATRCAVMDEANYMIDNQNRSVAQNLYGMLYGSMITRYRNHYKLIIVSSFANDETFMHRRILQAKESGDTYVGRVRRMRIADEAMDLGGGHKLITVVADREHSEAEVRRTLASEHSMITIDTIGGWRREGEKWLLDVEVRPGALVHGL